MNNSYNTLHYVISLLKAYNIKNIVASPGTQNSTFNYLVQEDEDFNCYSVVDERSAVYVAIGLSEETKEPTVITCTGATGILIGLILKTLGKNVPFILRNERKLPFLKSLGFESFIDLSSNKNFDVLFECVGSNQSLQNCIKYVRSRGQIILVGNPESNVQLDKKIYWKILRSEVTIEGVWNSSYKNNKKDDWDTAIEFLYKNSELVSKLITHEFDLSDSPHAFEKIKKGGELYIKGVFINEK